VVEDGSAGVIDLLFGAVLVYCAVRAQSSPGVHRYWWLGFWVAAASAFAGAAHHLVFKGSRQAAELSWVVVGVLVALAISYLLAASALELFGPRAVRIAIGLRCLGLGAYLVAAAFGLGGTQWLLLCESLTMASVVGLWIYAVAVNYPGGGRMLIAIVANALPTLAFVLPAQPLRDHANLDPASLVHLGQIPGMLLLCSVLCAGAVRASGRVGDAGAGVGIQTSAPE
jgi:hypothetical protein